MKKNYELSKKLNDKYPIQKNLCAHNAFLICQNEKLDITIGFIEHKNIHFIHVWNVKNNKIVDASIYKDYGSYIEVMKVDYETAIKNNISGSYEILDLIKDKFTILDNKFVHGFDYPLAINLKTLELSDDDFEFIVLSAAINSMDFD